MHRIFLLLLSILCVLAVMCVWLVATHFDGVLVLNAWHYCAFRLFIGGAAHRWQTV